MAFTTIQGSGANDATTFVGTSGVDSMVFGGSIGNFFVDAQGDTDSVTFLPSQNTSNFLIVSDGTVRLGDGDDILIAQDVIFASVLINGNADNDVFFFENSGNADAITSLEGSSVYGGDGNDLIDISETSILGSRINGNKGDDDISLLDVDVIRSSIFGGQGEDVIDIDSTAAGDSIFTDSVINGDLGEDDIDITAVLINTVINGGADDDEITVDASAGNEDSTVFGGAGNDTINVTGVEFIIQGNDGDDSIDVSGTDNTITGGSGVDDIDITVHGDNTIIQTTGAAATAFDVSDGDAVIIFGNGVDLIIGADDDTVLAFAGELTDDTSFVDDATSGLNFYVGNFTEANATTIAFFTVDASGDDLLFGSGVGNGAATFSSFGSNAVVLVDGALNSFDITNYDNLLA